ncbi:MAG: hypothetical protein QW416_01520 [Candidatus Nitrosocaldaceae archaeon]
MTSISNFFHKYRDAILFNKNLIISGAGGFFASAYVSQLYSEYDDNEFVNSVVALITEYAVYIPLFALLFYVNNKNRYVDPLTGKKNTKQLRHDIKKLFATFSISEVIFSITRVLTQYQLLQSDIQAYEVSMVSSIIAWAVFFIAVNVMVKLVKLFKKV